MTSICEQICAAAAQAISGATDADTNVFRNRAAAYAPEELPALEVARGLQSSDLFAAGIDKASLDFRVAVLVRHGTDAETALDVLHAQAHAALLASPTLAKLGRGLRLTETAEPELVAGDPDVARLQATYSIQILYRRADLGRAVL